VLKEIARLLQLVFLEDSMSVDSDIAAFLEDSPVKREHIWRLGWIESMNAKMRWVVLWRRNWETFG
jgi:hypothetical protein